MCFTDYRSRQRSACSDASAGDRTGRPSQARPWSLPRVRGRLPRRRPLGAGKGARSTRVHRCGRDGWRGRGRPATGGAGRSPRGRCVAARPWCPRLHRRRVGEHARSYERRATTFRVNMPDILDLLFPGASLAEQLRKARIGETYLRSAPVKARSVPTAAETRLPGQIPVPPASPAFRAACRRTPKPDRPLARIMHK